MRISPLDIQQMMFKVRMRGYDRREVDQFLEEIAGTIEALNRDNALLREKLAVAETQLVDLKKTESALTNTLVSTQSMTEDLKQSAKRDAELIMKEAELKAVDLLRGGREELAVLQREILDLRKQRILAIERLRATLRTFERILEIETGDEDEATAMEARAERLASGPPLASRSEP